MRDDLQVTSFSTNVQQALNAETDGDYISAFRQLRRGARQGESECMERLAHYYLTGLVVGKDATKAVWWLQRASEAGNADSAFTLAGLLADGSHGIHSSLAHALWWFTKAANLGHIPAMERLGESHEKGLGVRRDIKKAVEWYESAAKLGSVKALMRLADIYQHGHLGEPDINKARLSLMGAAERSHAPAFFALSDLYADYGNRGDDMVTALALARAGTALAPELKETGLKSIARISVMVPAEKQKAAHKLARTMLGIGGIAEVFEGQAASCSLIGAVSLLNNTITERPERQTQNVNRISIRSSDEPLWPNTFR